MLTRIEDRDSLKTMMRTGICQKNQRALIKRRKIIIFGSSFANVNARSNAWIESQMFPFPPRAMPLEIQPVKEG
jgi:hypothetical protein